MYNRGISIHCQRLVSRANLKRVVSLATFVEQTHTYNQRERPRETEREREMDRPTLKVICMSNKLIACALATNDLPVLGDTNELVILLF